MKKLFCIIITIFLLASCVNAFCQEQELVFAYNPNNIESEDDGFFEIVILLKTKSGKYETLYRTYSALEYFKFLGRLVVEDGSQHIVFEEYSLPDGMTTLFYFSSSELMLYVTESFEEIAIPLHFSLNPSNKTIKALSIEYNNCGEQVIRKVHKVIAPKEQKYYKEKLPEDFIVLQRIRL